MRFKYGQFLGIVVAALIVGAPAFSVMGDSELPPPASGLSAMIWDAGADLPDVFQLQDGDTIPNGAELHLWQGGRGTEVVVVPYGARSERFNLKNGREVVFLKRPFTPGQEDDNPPVAGRVSVPEGVSQALVLLIPRDLLNNDYQAVVLDESPSVFPKNSLRLVNFTNTPLIIKVGEKTYEIMARSSEVAPVDIGGGRTTKMLVARPRGEGHDFISKRISVFDGVRSTCFFVEDPSNGTLRMKVITENTASMNPPQPTAGTRQ